MSEEKRAFRPRRPPPPPIEHFPYIEVPHKDGFRYRFTVYTGGIRCTRRMGGKTLSISSEELPETMQALLKTIRTEPVTPNFNKESVGKMPRPRFHDNSD